VDQHGQVVEVLVSKGRDQQAARRFFRRALTTLKVIPTEVVTDAAPVYPRVLDELIPAACGTTSNSMRTTGSKPTTAASTTDDDPCAGCVPSGRLK
jgi:transposase-like protein